MTMFHYAIVTMRNISNFVPTIGIRMNQKVRWDVNNTLQTPQYHARGNQSARDIQKFVVLTWTHHNPLM